MTQRWTIPLLVLAFIAFYLLPLGTHGLWIPDETRYAQIGQQILVDGNWITPHFMDLRYFEKTCLVCVLRQQSPPASACFWPMP